MAKGHKRGNREFKKPKAVRKVSPEAEIALLQLRGKMPPAKAAKK
ncbi:hypothetical protein [Komagataeibacter xylinus]|nr:hypothetical protein [Komagataeibacter xylinus]